MRVTVRAQSILLTVVLCAVLLVVPSAWVSAQDAIPALDLWKSHMVSYGQKHCEWLITNQDMADINPPLGATYYDATRVYYQIGEYTGNAAVWSPCALAARHIYRDRYLVPNNGGVPGYWNFTTGLRMDFAKTGDPLSKYWGIKLSTSAAYTPDRTDYSWVSPNLSREMSYAVLSYINAEKLGAAPRAQRASYVNFLYGFIDGWVKNTWVGTTQQVAPFMMSLTAAALIEDAEHKGGDARLVPALGALADWLWANAWETSNQAFRYELNPQATNYSAPGDGGARDLNLLIAPLYAYVWKQTNEQRFRDRGDAAFASGVQGAWLYGVKQFNQNYWWSFDYVKWRSAPTSTPTEPVPPTGGSPTPVTVAFAAPTDGTVVQQTVTVSAAATGSVSSLRLYLNGAQMAAAAGGSVSHLWDTRLVPNGSHSWKARAFDAADNELAASTVTTQVNNPVSLDTTPPSVTLSSTGDQTRKSTVTFRAAASDNVAVAKVELYINGTLFCISPGASYACDWRIPAAPNKTYTVQAKAYDAAGNTAVSAPITIVTDSREL